YGVIGAWSLDIARLMAETLSGMPIVRLVVVHGDTGWDEPTPAAPFTLLDVRPGAIAVSRRTAADFGLPECAQEELLGGDAGENARRLEAVLRGCERGGHRDALVMGAALVAEVTGTVAGPVAGVALANAAIDDGRAARLLDGIVAQARRRTG
ncbi:MAG: anthranilate phosphoribosyltransferase, partial [Gammaproteobacteria bacterium]